MPDTSPARRGPGRPRKVAAEAETPPGADPAPGPADTPATSGGPTFPADERIGQTVADSRWTAISYSDDDRQYRVENGVIVERTR